ncbi:MAG: NAD(P)H-dependent oxidoreductase [Candidatus Omnitrophota bacterium]
MKRLLHIIASPRADWSRTLRVSGAFLEGFASKFPDCQIDSLNISIEKLTPLTLKRVNGKYTLLAGKDLDKETKKAWKEIEQHIERFVRADIYLISTPMWNFSIPYYLKHYIDIIVQPNYLFKYTPNGPEGLVKGKKMIIVTSRGGDYSPDSPFHSYDYQEPYLRTIFGFVGITDLTFVNVQPLDALGPEIAAKRIQEAQVKLKEILEQL